MSLPWNYLLCQTLLFLLEEITSPSSNAKLIEVVFLGTPMGWKPRILCVSLPTGITQSVLRYYRNKAWLEQQGIPLGWKLLLLECLPFVSSSAVSDLHIWWTLSLPIPVEIISCNFFTTPYKRLPSLGMMKWTFKCMHIPTNKKRIWSQRYSTYEVLKKKLEWENICHTFHLKNISYG